jgi:transporter family-2 protein
MLGAQGRINGELETRSHSALFAASASFTVGLVIMLAALAFRRAGISRLRTGSVKWWWCLGGLGGAFAVASSAHAIPQIGVALVSVCLVAGTTVGALISDQLGIGPSGRHAPSFWRLTGVAVVILAVAIGAVGDRHGSLKPALVILLLAAGATTAVQQATNGQLNRVSGDVIVASAVSFLGGTTVLVIVTLAAGQAHPGSWPTVPWLYLGGPLGVVYILIGAAMVRVLGVLRLVLGIVAGQLIVSVVLDAAWPEPGTSLRATTVVGAVITVGGVWLSGRDSTAATATDALPRGDRSLDRTR